MPAVQPASFTTGKEEPIPVAAGTTVDRNPDDTDEGWGSVEDIDPHDDGRFDSLIPSENLRSVPALVGRPGQPPARQRSGQARGPARSGRHADGDLSSPWWIAPVGAIVVIMALGLVGNAVLRYHRPSTLSGPRVLLYGDSLLVEAHDAFQATAKQDGASAILDESGAGGAPCNYLPDVPNVVKNFHPTIAIIAFSGNTPACMAGRDLIDGYQEDVTEMIDILASAGVAVRLVETPARFYVDPVDADGRTALGRLWQQLAATFPDTKVVRADLAVTDHGRFVTVLPCERAEKCGPDGLITVRGPDGVHFCPTPDTVTRRCEGYSPGAHRYGVAIAQGALA